MFAGMNNRTENTVQCCFNCQIAMNMHHTEPAKMTTKTKQ